MRMPRPSAPSMVVVLGKFFLCLTGVLTVQATTSVRPRPGAVAHVPGPWLHIFRGLVPRVHVACDRKRAQEELMLRLHQSQTAPVLGERAGWLELAAEVGWSPRCYIMPKTSTRAQLVCDRWVLEQLANMLGKQVDDSQNRAKSRSNPRQGWSKSIESGRARWTSCQI